MAGLYTPVWGALPKAPEVSILGVSSALQIPYKEWRTGLAARPTACVRTYSHGSCPTVDRKQDTSPKAMREFDPWWLYAEIECDWLLPESYDRHAREVEAKLEANTAFAMARDIWVGSTDDGQLLSTSFANTAVDISGSSAVNAVGGIASLIGNYEDCAQTDEGVLHIPSTVLNPLMGSHFDRVGGRVYTKLGMPVSVGPGYPNAPGPWGPGGQLAADGEAWVYITGPMEHGIGPVEVVKDANGTQLGQARRNARVLVAQRQVIVRFDTCCAFAIKVKTICEDL